PRGGGVIHLPESIGLSEAAMAETQKAAKRGTAGKRKAGGAKRSTGRIQVRRDTAEYRAAAQEQAARVREEIDTALADARRIREEIEARIETQWHNRPAPKATEAKGGGRRRRAKA
ncbi:MAG TPA: hypothetical protein VNA24_17685, partial [Hyalangium sp.]|nr:hypothetical protein [Hyalangium sp.]